MNTMEDFHVIDHTIDIEISGNVTKGILGLLYKAFPDITLDENAVHPIAAGFINKVFRVTRGEFDVVVRIYTAVTGVIVPDVDEVVRGMQAVYRAGLGAKIHATFSNGIVYDYQNGECVNPDIAYLDKPEIRNKVAVIAAKICSIQTPDNREIPSEPKAFDDIHRWLDHIPDNFKGRDLYGSDLQYFDTKEALMKESDWIINEVKNLKIPLKFSHGDYWWANALYDTKTDTITAIDYDMCGFNIFSFDLSHYLITGVMSLSPPKWKPVEEKEEEMLSRVFLDEIKRNNDSGPVTDDELFIFLSINKAVKVLTFFHANTCGTILSMHHDFSKIMPELVKGYCTLRTEYIEHKAKYPERFITSWIPY